MVREEVLQIPLNPPLQKGDFCVYACRLLQKGDFCVYACRLLKGGFLCLCLSLVRGNFGTFVVILQSKGFTLLNNLGTSEVMNQMLKIR